MLCGAIIELCFAVVVLLASSGSGLQHTMDWFTGKSKPPGMGISTSKSVHGGVED